jgi:hypothetical protein
MLQASQPTFASGAQVGREFQIQRREAIIHLHGVQQILTSLSGPDAAERQELEDFVREVFKRVHGAEVKYFMPQLMSLRDSKGNLLAVCGLRHASEGRLFLETYLDEPIEAVLSKHIGKRVAREDIVEVGNLAVAEPANIRSLLASVSLYLHGTAKQWAVFTGIPAIRNSLSKLNLQLEILGKAERNALPENERAAWGRYYDEGPQVMAVRRAQHP